MLTLSKPLDPLRLTYEFILIVIVVSSVVSAIMPLPSIAWKKSYPKCVGWAGLFDSNSLTHSNAKCP